MLNMKWYNKNPPFFEEFKLNIQESYPALQLSIISEVCYLSGRLYLYDIKKIEIDSYDIQIKLLDNYPQSVPEVHEIGGRIPKIMDRHFFPGTTQACIFLMDEKHKYYDSKTPIVKFIKDSVEPFFLAQTFYEHERKWLFGERRHGILGILDYYGAILNNHNPLLILNFLFYLQNSEVKGHWNCFCGSGKILRKCHYPLIIEYKTKISPQIARFSGKQIYDYLMNQKQKKKL